MGFEQTSEIAPGGSETVTVTVNRKDFISYDDMQAKTYILEAGDYLILIGEWLVAVALIVWGVVASCGAGKRKKRPSNRFFISMGHYTKNVK